MRSLRKHILPFIALCAAALGAGEGKAQTYLKLNGLYATVGLINPQVEFRISEHSAFQTEVVISPWKSILGGHHMSFGIAMGEYRYFFGFKTRGLYVGGNAGMEVFNMSRPDIAGGLHFQNRYCKGYGFMFGACVGYEHYFAKRWVVDAFIGGGYICTWYNGYSFDGKIDMNPHRPEWKQPKYPDPFNASAEWFPNKIGIAIGYMLTNPNKRR